MIRPGTTTHLHHLSASVTTFNLCTSPSRRLVCVSLRPGSTPRRAASGRAGGPRRELSLLSRLRDAGPSCRPFTSKISTAIFARLRHACRTASTPTRNSDTRSRTVQSKPRVRRFASPAGRVHGGRPRPREHPTHTVVNEQCHYSGARTMWSPRVHAHRGSLVAPIQYGFPPCSLSARVSSQRIARPSTIWSWSPARAASASATVSYETKA